MKIYLKHLLDYKQRQIKEITEIIVEATDPERPMLFRGHVWAGGQNIAMLKTTSLIIHQRLRYPGRQNQMFKCISYPCSPKFRRPSIDLAD